MLLRFNFIISRFQFSFSLFISLSFSSLPPFYESPCRMQASLLLLQQRLLCRFQSGLEVSGVGRLYSLYPLLPILLISSSSGLPPSSSYYPDFRLRIPSPQRTPLSMTFPLFYLYVSYCGTSLFLASINGLACVLSGFSIKLDCWGGGGGWGYVTRISG